MIRMCFLISSSSSSPISGVVLPSLRVERHLFQEYIFYIYYSWRLQSKTMQCMVLHIFLISFQSPTLWPKKSYSKSFWKMRIFINPSCTILFCHKIMIVADEQTLLTQVLQRNFFKELVYIPSSIKASIMMYQQTVAWSYNQLVQLLCTYLVIGSLKSTRRKSC
jgi:hypothetical protein